MEDNAHNMTEKFNIEMEILKQNQRRGSKTAEIQLST